jgi:bifunctional DNase/RNase
MSDRLVEMVVESVRVHMLNSQHVVILKETDRERYLPIWIGPWEANAIAMKLQGLAPERPLTHDLFAATLEELGVTVRRVVIADLADETFRARLLLDANGRPVEIDSRPSDAVALAVRTGAEIFAAEEVLDRAGVSPESGEDDDESTAELEEGEVGSRSGPPPEEREGRAGKSRLNDPRLDVFREFVNSLGVDQEGEKREGPTPE